MQQPDGLVTVRINRETGELAGPDESGAIFEIFREEDVPSYGNDAAPGSRVNNSSEAAESIF
jgi:penicillin-binding protein 1A